jgi:hypothetical protein
VRDDVVSILVPKPQAGFEGDYVVRCHQTGVAEKINPNVIPASAVIVVPVHMMNQTFRITSRNYTNT